MKTTAELLELIKLKKIEEYIFEGKSSYMGSRNVFGGQVISQALYAAYQTVPEDRFCHSLHAYFILPGNLELPIYYEVNLLRNGGSFTTRSIIAKQEGRAIFMMACSFQLEQKGYNHQIEMPKDIKEPTELIGWYDIVQKFGDFLPKPMLNFMAIDRPLEFKPVNLINPLQQQNYEPVNNVWFKFTDAPSNLTTAQLQQLIAYASDYNVLSTSLLPHASKANLSNTQLASLDHSLWFHRKPVLNDWLLIHVDSPSSSNARGFTNGSIFNKNGELVCSLAQEGLIRPLQ